MHCKEVCKQVSFSKHSLHILCRLPYAVVIKPDIPKQIQTAAKQLQRQRGDKIRGVGAQKQLLGVLNNMINPGKLDTYIKPRQRPTPVGAAIIDFRRSYVANKVGGGANESASYDGRGSVSQHARRLLLSAECQIGKTGAYLALLLELQKVLKAATQPAVSDIAVLLPGTSLTDGPAEADDASPQQGTLFQVDTRYIADCSSFNPQQLLTCMT